jgi:hypothetical protein
MSKGGTTTSTSSIDPQIKEAFLANFQQAQGVAGALPVQQFAGYNPIYQAGEEALVNTALAGPGITGTDLAAQMAAYGGVYQPAQLTAQQTNLGMTGPGSIGSYMNPYTSMVRENALADLESARRAAIQQTGERATAARAFGGSRQGVAESLTNLGFAKQAGTLGTQLNEQAFNQAMAMQQADIGRRSAADIANQQAGLQGAQLRLGGASQLSWVLAVRVRLWTSNKWMQSEILVCSVWVWSSHLLVRSLPTLGWWLRLHTQEMWEPVFLVVLRLGRK